MRVYVRAGLRYIRLCRQAEQQISNRVPSEYSLVNRKRAKIIGATETFQILVTHMAHVGAELHGVAAFDPAQIVGELDRLRLGGAIFVPPNRRVIAGIITKVKDRKSSRI